MSIQYASSLKPILDNEISVTSPTSDETVKKVVINTNFLIKLFPIASILPFSSETPGVTSPSTVLYRPCDDSEIVDDTSPLATSDTGSRLTPDFQNHYVRGANDLVTNSTGGSSSANLSHNHTGNTGNNNPARELLKSGTNFNSQASQFHVHTIQSDLGTINITPLATEFRLYLKIN